MIPIKIVPIKAPIRTKTTRKIPGSNRINIGPGQEPTSPQTKKDATRYQETASDFVKQYRK